jgi:murein L,D-transpeptidase YafK
VAALSGLLVLGAISACAPAPLPVSPPPPIPQPELLPEPPPTPAPDPRKLACDVATRIEVRKRERVLEARCENGALRTFAIALSRNPEGGKRTRGDERTPEGDYRIAGEARPSRFHLFIAIDYPSPADAERALAERRITAREHGEILGAHAAGRMPPQETPLGGRLGLHGEGQRWRGDLDLDWTEGCIALSNEAIEWLARHAPPGTPIRILP